MGLSSEAILIKPHIEEGQFTAFLQQLGIVQPKFNKKAFFEEADVRGKSGIYIGNYKGATFLIYDQVLEGERGSDLLTNLERQLAAALPEHEILGLSNIESSNSYLYHYIKAGKSIRLKQGNYLKVIYDIGEELFLEKANYAKKEVDEDGEVVYYTASTTKLGELDTWSHDQIGGTIAFSLAEMMIGQAYDQIPLDICLHQYLPQKELTQFKRIPIPTTGQGIRYFHREVIKSEFLPILEEQIVPFFQSKGFQYKPSKFELLRDINSIQQSIQFTLHPNTNLLFDLYISYDVNASQLLREWSINKYNKNTFGNGNEIDNRQPILKYEHLLPDPVIESDSAIINTETFAQLLLDYLKQHILPYFDFFAGYKAFAEYAYYKCFRADFYYMMGESEKALRVLAELYESVHQSDTRRKYLDDIQVRLRYELPDTPIDELLKMIIRDDAQTTSNWGEPENNEELLPPPPTKKNKNWWNKLME
ncbi:MAG: hypothetical protein ACPGJS_00270 [Flammeovirgaceae bacterium]